MDRLDKTVAKQMNISRSGARQLIRSGAVERAGIKVIRLGLHSGGDVEGSFVAGAYHPALREMCEGHIYFDIINRALSGKEKGKYIIYVAPREVSKASGQRRCNIEKLRELGYECRIKENAALSARDITLEKVNLL